VLLCWRGEIPEEVFEPLDDDGEPLEVTVAGVAEATPEQTPERTPAAPIPAATPATMVSNAASSHQFAPLAVPFAKPPLPQPTIDNDPRAIMNAIFGGPSNKARPRSSQRHWNTEPPFPVVNKPMPFKPPPANVTFPVVNEPPVHELLPPRPYKLPPTCPIFLPPRPVKALPPYSKFPVVDESFPPEWKQATAWKASAVENEPLACNHPPQGPSG
jgi:hypothetical protein